MLQVLLGDMPYIVELSVSVYFDFFMWCLQFDSFDNSENIDEVLSLFEGIREELLAEGEMFAHYAYKYTQMKDLQ